MNFCPFPHSLRDQAWLAVGLGCGVLLMRKLRMKETPPSVHVLLVNAKFESVDHKKKFKQIWSNIANKVKEVEPNCLSYEFCDAVEDPTKAIIYERYVTRVDLDGPHQKTLEERDGFLALNIVLPRDILSCPWQVSRNVERWASWNASHAFGCTATRNWWCEWRKPTRGGSSRSRDSLLWPSAWKG
eukprot:g7516.t1